MNTPIPLYPGDHLLYGTKPFDFFGWVTSKKTWSPAVHIEIYTGTGMSVASRNGIGVNSYTYRSEQLIAVLRPPKFYNVDAALSWFNVKYDKQTNTGVRGRPYGWWDLARFIGLNINTRGYICSEFAAMFDHQAGYYPFTSQYPAESVDPGDYLIIKEFQWEWVDKSVNDFFGIGCDVHSLNSTF